LSFLILTAETIPLTLSPLKGLFQGAWSSNGLRFFMPQACVDINGSEPVIDFSKYLS